VNVLLLGGGGREHALAWKLRQSPRVSRLVCAPGNAGIAEMAECLPVELGNIDSLLDLAQRIKPDLTIVGPELPLSVGVVDAYRERGLAVFGPTQAAARLETSKSFAKEFMLRHHIPTGHFAVCPNEAELRDALAHLHAPLVVKADGLAAGKGVVITPTKEEALRVATEMLSGAFIGDAGRRVVLEEFLQGEELSFLVITDGERALPLAPARDHKRLGDGDTGPNTGGMGAYSADGLLDPEMQHWLLAHIVAPVLKGMKQEGNLYCGVLYCGLMMTARGPMVLEFNCRFGDPETQPIMMRFESDLLGVVEAATAGRLAEAELHWSSDAAACVVIAAPGYPAQPHSGARIEGLADAAGLPDVQVFHAGTAQRADGIYTAGGRVLGVTARGAALTEAVGRAYAAVERIRFDGLQYRRDIGRREF
jgi:phosphoribosylamine--glycine ligase